MQFGRHSVFQLIRVDDDAVLGIFNGDGLLVVLDIGIGVLRVLVVLIMDVGQGLI